MRIYIKVFNEVRISNMRKGNSKKGIKSTFVIIFIPLFNHEFSFQGVLAGLGS